MIELYLSTLILYCLLAIVIGFGIGWGTLVQDIKKGETFNFLYMFTTSNCNRTAILVQDWFGVSASRSR